MDNISKKIISIYQESSNPILIQEKLATLSYETGICIEITNAYSQTSYTTNNKECMKGSTFNNDKRNFIESNQTTDQYLTINPLFKNKTLIYALKLDNSTYIFLSSSLVPISSTITILKNQFIYVSIIVLLLSFAIAYFISRHLSKPIVEITKAAQKLAQGNYNVNFKTEEDIAEINELSTTLNYAKDELSKTEELRRDLMANVSHDLKTPLTMIKAYAEMVKDLTYKDKQKREANLNVIIEEVDRLNHLVNDILSLSVMESKMIQLNIEEFDLIDLIQTIINHYQIFESTLDYHFELKSPTKLLIKADKHKIEQVMYNLINNAINYTGDDKKIFIKITEETQCILVEVMDTGKGISKIDQQKIWNKYYKTSKNHQRMTVGTGLGLAIVKNILQLHNYEYGVKSKEGEGTTFHFKIKN
ncbi:MAG: HAMP domain-containing sensor histidine kinase [bacterium]|nr:HAMP domain-containing sensor histidine kinase [bacterium]